VFVAAVCILIIDFAEYSDVLPIITKSPFTFTLWRHQQKTEMDQQKWHSCQLSTQAKFVKWKKRRKKKHAQMFNWGLCYKHVKSMGSLSTCYIGEGSLGNTAVQLKTQTQRDNRGINQTLPSDLPPSTNNWCFQDTTKFLSFLWVRATGTDLIITCTHIQKKKEGMTKLVPHSISNFCLSSL